MNVSTSLTIFSNPISTFGTLPIAHSKQLTFSIVPLLVSIVKFFGPTFVTDLIYKEKYQGVNNHFGGSSISPCVN